MTLDNPNLITYGMNNSHADYRYYQSIVSEQQQQNKSAYQSSTNNNVRKQPSPIQQPQPIPVQYHRPERPKTLDTQPTIPITTTTTTTVAAATVATNSKSLPFDEQEEWKKISEIMANFGTDTDILQDSMLGNAMRSHDRCENGRSNSIAGLTQTQMDRQRNAIKRFDSLNKSLQRKSGSQSPHSQLINFLCDHQLEELKPILYDNGYDDIEFLRGILDETDLESLEIKPEIGKKLMKAIEIDLQIPARAITTYTKSITNNSSSTNNDKSPQNHRNNVIDDCEMNSNSNNNNYSTIPKQKTHNSHETNGTLSVNEWLASIRLPQYAEVFRKHLYTDMERISRVWEIELQAVLEINKIGHRKRILYSVGAVPSKNQEIFEKLSKDTQDKARKVNTSQKSLISNSSLESNNTNVSDAPIEPREINRPNHRKNRQAPKPPTQAKIANDLKETTTNLEIRAPSELLLGFPTGLRTQWRHSAEMLITGSVKYEVNYLGSTVIKELRGTESTKKSIQKLKKTDNIMANNSSGGSQGSTHHNTERAVLILISYRGVQFVDPQTKGTICEHEIRNINCACQDADDLSHFAYITKDSDYNKHYCHVFNVASMDLATEIILTLGQAFEVAYQIALRKSKPTTPIKNSVNNSSERQQTQKT